MEEQRRGGDRYDPNARFDKEFWIEDCAVPQ